MKYIKVNRQIVSLEKVFGEGWRDTLAEAGEIAKEL